jgi:sulfonate transport system substrate-binding protein
MGGTPIGAIASGQPIRIVALVEHSPKTHAILVRPNSAVKSIADLKGKKLGTPLGKNYAFPLRVLTQAGIKDTDVQWIKLENNEGRSALLTGAIDAWATWDPFYASVEVTKEAVALVDGEKYNPNYVTIFARADYLSTYPETVKRFLQNYKQALDYVKTNHKAAIDLFVKENKLTPEVAELTFSRRSYLLGVPNEEYKTDVVDQSKLLHQLGVISKEPDWSTIIDTRVATQALSS